MAENYKSIFSKSRMSILLLGLAGGIALIITHNLILNSTTLKGYTVFLPYTLLLVAAILTLKLSQIQGFKDRLVAGMSIYMIATILAYLYPEDGKWLWTAEDSFFRNIWEHAWRLGLMVWIGLPAGLIVAQLSAPKQQNLTT